MRKKIFSITIKTFYFTIGIIFLAIGILGLILPIIPGIVFILASVALFAKASLTFRNHKLYINFSSYMEKFINIIKSYFIRKHKVIIAHAVVAILILGAIILFGINMAKAETLIGSDVQQVKTANSPAVYYIDQKHNTKKVYNSAKAFLSYGNKWSDVKIVDNSVLNNYADVSLVKVKNNKAVYYIKNGKKAVIKNSAEFLNHGFKWSDVVTISVADLNTYSNSELDSICAIKPAAGNVSTSLSASAGSITNGSLSVEVSVNSPATQYIPLGSVDNLIGVFKFTNNSNTNVEVGSFSPKFTGVFNPQMIKAANLVIDNQTGQVYESIINDKKAYFSFNTNPIVIQPGESKEFKIYLDTKYYPEWNSHVFRIAIENPSDVFTKSQSQILGNFPVASNTHKLVYSADYLGQIKVEEQSLNRTQEAVIGNSGQELAKFKISELSKNEGMIMKQIAFRNYGTANSGDIINFTLKNKNNAKISQAASINSDGTVTFNLNDYKIAAGKDDVFIIIADIKDGENKTVNFQFTDLKARGDKNGYGLTSDYANLNETIKIVRKSISAISRELKISKNIFSQQSGALIGVFEIRNNDQNIILDTAEIKITKTNGTPNFDKPIYLVNYNTGEVYSSASQSGNDNLTFRLASTVLKSKEILTVGFIADIPDTAKQGDSYNLSLENISYRLPSGAYPKDNIKVNSATLIVSKSNIFVYKNEDSGDTVKYIKGEKDIKIASFYIEAAYGEDTRISSLKFSKGDTSGLITYDNGFSNLKAYINGTRIGAVLAQPYSDTYIFDGASYRLKSGERAEIKVYVDTEKDLPIQSTQLMINNIVANGYSSGINTVVKGLNTKSYTVSFGGVNAEIRSVLGGDAQINKENNKVASFAVKNTGDEKIKLNSISLITTGDGFSYSRGYHSLDITESQSTKNIGSAGRPVAGANKIGLNGYEIQPNSEKTFDVYVDTNDKVAISQFDLYFSELSAQGSKSKINVKVVGSPTTSVQVNSGSNTVPDSDNGNGNNTASTTEIMIYPVSGRITYGFGANASSGYPYGTHTGVDFNVSKGTSVKASAAGTVSYVEPVGQAGGATASYIIINHGNGIQTMYGHLSRIDVKVGDVVTQSQVVGLSGGIPGDPGSGSNTTGAHLHFEVQLNGTPVNPMNYLK
ncbi:MAG: peptidoglycan DD-metalloendopeptidase family protein [Patescibacteria group bacterium]|nr:peptidoglycan DD-metalloendopeptidase family protein [Patescibacteria group bacterium]MDD4611287.1 peptidoglycan DD-metalloendopeptidase family protein [Patescibacteria group bacterium]